MEIINVQQNIEQSQTPTMGVTINKSQQQQNHRLRTDSSLSHRGGGGLNAFYWYQIFTLDSAVVEVQKMFSSHGGHLCVKCDPKQKNEAVSGKLFISSPELKAHG